MTATAHDALEGTASWSTRNISAILYIVSILMQPMKTPALISIFFIAATCSITAVEPTDLTEARNQYLQSLRRMKDAFTSDGKIADARAVQAEIEALSPSSGLEKRLADTTWAYSSKANDPHPTLTVTIHADQTVSWSDRPSLHVGFHSLDERTLQVKDRVWKFSADLRSFTIHSDMSAPAHRWGTRLKSPTNRTKPAALFRRYSAAQLCDVI